MPLVAWTGKLPNAEDHNRAYEARGSRNSCSSSQIRLSDFLSQQQPARLRSVEWRSWKLWAQSYDLKPTSDEGSALGALEHHSEQRTAHWILLLIDWPAQTDNFIPSAHGSKFERRKRLGSGKRDKLCWQSKSGRVLLDLQGWILQNFRGLPGDYQRCRFAQGCTALYP